MGAWGYGPWENDGALDWLGAPQDFLIAYIKKTLSKFMQTKTDRSRSYQYEEVVAAAALLDELTPYRRTNFKRGGKKVIGWGSIPGTRLHLHYEAEIQKLYTLAAGAVVTVEGDDEFIKSWRTPIAKRRALRKLIGSLEKKTQQEYTPKKVKRSKRGWAKRKRG